MTSAIAINVIAAAVSFGMITSSILKAQDRKFMTAALRFAIGAWILYLAVEAIQ